ncbi:hypothetical protein J8805_29165, partial [Klebsiella pneumoniae]
MQVNDKTWHYYSLPLAEKQLGEISRLPKSLKVLMENLLRWQDVDLVIDHSVTVDRFGDDEAFEDNVRLEMERNHERYAFLRWGQ